MGLRAAPVIANAGAKIETNSWQSRNPVVTSAGLRGLLQAAPALECPKMLALDCLTFRAAFFPIGNTVGPNSNILLQCIDGCADLEYDNSTVKQLLKR